MRRTSVSTFIFGRAHCSRGSALTELAISLPIYALLLQGVLHFGNAYVLKQRVVISGRYAAWRAQTPKDSKEAGVSESTQRYYPTGSRSSISVGKGSWGNSASLAVAVRDATDVGWSIVSMATTPPALLAVFPLWVAANAPGDSTLTANVSAWYEPRYLPWMKGFSITYSHTVPGDPWCKEDYNSEDLFYPPEVSAAGYITAQLPW